MGAAIVLPDPAGAANYSASDAKAKLGEVIERAATTGLATITRRGKQRFAVLPMETLEALLAAAEDRELDAIAAEYEELIAAMDSPEGRSAADALFSATPKELGEGAARWHRERNSR